MKWVSYAEDARLFGRHVLYDARELISDIGIEASEYEIAGVIFSPDANV